MDGLAGIESMLLARRLIMFKESDKPVLTKGGENRGAAAPQVAHWAWALAELSGGRGAGGRSAGLAQAILLPLPHAQLGRTALRLCIHSMPAYRVY